MLQKFIDNKFTNRRMLLIVSLHEVHLYAIVQIDILPI